MIFYDLIDPSRFELGMTCNIKDMFGKDDKVAIVSKSILGLRIKRIGYISSVVTEHGIFFKDDEYALMTRDKLAIRDLLCNKIARILPI